MAGKLATLHFLVPIIDNSSSRLCLSDPSAGVASHCPPSKRQYPHNMQKAVLSLPSSISDSLWSLQFQMPWPLLIENIARQLLPQDLCSASSFSFPSVHLFPVLVEDSMFPTFQLPTVPESESIFCESVCQPDGELLFS